ncbi:hypothetical protein [Luteipulveratus mongoliensis]|uniref:Lipoprotein n=1 Tax=Luteipulveratus mongoliensis TaxID=571913 RepID=A0A0K1JM13_9MICO|nr:hypothetical protein [Luteipulveratus mongoliensis]AKU17746.1 hypothetical protein VV02_20995 [Luteipulveratus mongoliensis]
MTKTRRVLTITTAAALAAGSATVATTSHADAASKCATSTSSGPSFYPGPMASKTYNAHFGQGPKMPWLDTHTPQGLGTWANWDGSSHDLLVMSSYRSGHDSYLTGIDAKTGKRVGTVKIAESHVGGVAIVKGWAFVSGARSHDEKKPTIRKYKLSDLRKAMKTKGTPFLKQTGDARIVRASSFLAPQDGYLWAGKFNYDKNDDMRRYKVGSDGSLTATGETWEVPKKTQGLIVTSGHFIFSTASTTKNRANVYVVKRGHRTLSKAQVKCFRAPSMAEGLTVSEGKVFLAFESGSHQYRGKARNPVANLHRADLSDLTSLVSDVRRGGGGDVRRGGA